MSKYTDTIDVIKNIIVNNQGADIATAHLAAKVIADALKAAHIISLPDPEVSTRTSVSVPLMAEIGKTLGCKDGEDADDICREMIRFLENIK